MVGGLAVACALGGLGGVRTLRAASSLQSQPSPPAWHAVETANFRILNFGSRGVSDATAQVCEQIRERLSARWLGSTGDWHQAKCQLILHPSDEAYLREVGQGARNTVGSSLIDRRAGRVIARRVDIRATQRNWQDAALAHELTHLILADRFADQSLPRWVDEGAAILADPSDKQKMHSRDLSLALAKQDAFRVHELMTLTDYPALGRWGTFYGQSASLVKYLVDESGEERFLEFVGEALAHGYEQGLQQIYHIGIAELERRWQTRLRAPTASFPAAQHGASPILRPVSLATPQSLPASDD